MTVLKPIYNLSNTAIVAYYDENKKPIQPLRSVLNGHIDRKEIYSLEDVLPHVVEKGRLKIRKEFDGDMMKVSSLRLFVFKEKGCTCVRCGLYGLYFAKEKLANDRSYHFNLYAIDDQGNEVLMTKDHIIPKFQGGKDDLENLQPMCSRCNCDIKNKEDLAKSKKTA